MAIKNNPNSLPAFPLTKNLARTSRENGFSSGINHGHPLPDMNKSLIVELESILRFGHTFKEKMF